MDIWILSQDKESLTKISNVQYSFINDLHIIGTYYDNLKVLGTYKTKERAIGVLDEIQETLMMCIKSNGNEHLVGTSCYVYQMPQE